jgi:hypothetical protein
MASSRSEQSRAALAPALLLLVAATCAVLRPDTPPQEWDDDWGPLVPHKTFPADCGICHVPERWDVLRADFSFDHAKETGFPLEGAHEGAACLRCHNDFGPVEEYVARGCAGCHLDVHRAELGSNCLECHNQRDWRPDGLVAEHARTRFPLVGAHIAAACEKCHERAPTGSYRGAPTRCELCHRDDLARAQSPDHAASGWTTSCERCHFPTGWNGADFAHAFFPLTGGHGGLACDRCHVGGDFRGLSRDCISCHLDDYQGAPNHVSGNYSQNCLQCHTTATWEGARFDHSFFPLNGGHAGLACIRCHTTGTTGPIPRDCVSCHSDDYQGAPNHVSGNFPQQCDQCHTTARWEGATFNHRFPLTGRHDVACAECHPGGNTATFTCFNCHGQAETDRDHDEVRNYRYDSAACYQCHPNGRGD